jgi:hypothetical protein
MTCLFGVNNNQSESDSGPAAKPNYAPRAETFSSTSIKVRLMHIHTGITHSPTPLSLSLARSFALKEFIMPSLRCVRGGALIKLREKKSSALVRLRTGVFAHACFSLKARHSSACCARGRGPERVSLSLSEYCYFR